MTIGIVIAASLMVVCPCLASPLLADGGEDLGSRVEEIFSVKCSQCHGEQLPKPKGRFGYVSDVARIAANEAYVIKGDPEDSEIYLVLVDEDEEYKMPPLAAKAGPMTVAEIETVRQWIAEGAAPPSPAKKDAEPDSGDTDSPVDGSPELENGANTLTGPPAVGENPPEIGVGKRLLIFLGKGHPLVVHFPIALSIAAFLAEIGWWRFSREWLNGGARFCVLMAGVIAPFAAGLGWLAGEFEGYGGFPLFLHRWLGVSSAVLAVAAAVLSERMRRSGTNWSCIAYRSVLSLNAVVVGITGHFGGVLVYGSEHFAW